MYITILLLPLLGASISGLFGRKIGITGSHLITTLFLLIASLLSSIAFYEIGISSSPVTIHLSQWIDSEFLLISWEFLFDSLTVSMLIPVLYVSTLVHIYSISYMSEDPHNQRFFSYLSLFTFFMVVLVTGANYLIMFIGWEGIGVSSYLLINFWYTRIQANKAAILAFTMNRVGDMSLSIAFFSLFWVFGNLDYASIFTLSPYINENLISIIGLLLLLAAMGKSAQIGLHGWLPGSMEGPTPVSALIHAATLVTAGVYLLMRSSPLIEYGSTALLVIMWVGSITAFFAASSGLLQNDLKRIIAFSTISQMGYLFMAVGLSQYNVALFHLVNHAFFKALLFLAAGSVIHAMHDQQDIRRLGGLISFLPFTYTSILIGSLSLMALPWLTGFYSKDLIIELAYAKYQFSGMACYYLGTLTAIFTAFYSFRLISLVFLTYPNAPKNDYMNSHEASLAIIIPLSLLSLASIFFGFIFSDLFVGMGTDFFGNSIFIHPNHISLIEAEFSLPFIYKLLPTIGSVFAALLALYLYHSKSLSIKNTAIFGGQALIELTDYSIGRKIYTFFNGKYLLDIIYNKYIIGKGLNVGYTIAKILDRGIYETVGPLGLSNHLMNTGKNISKLDNGKITDYATYMAIAAITIPVGIFMNINNFNRIFIFLLGSLILFNLIPNIFGSNASKTNLSENKNLTKSILPLPLINTFDYSDLYNSSNLQDDLSLINLSWRLEDIEQILNDSIQGIFNLYQDHIYLSMILFWIIVKFMYFFIHRRLYQLKFSNTINNLTYKLLNFVVLYIILRISLWLFIYPMLNSFLNTFNEYNSLANTIYSIIESDGPRACSIAVARDWRIWIQTILDITTGLTLFNVMNTHMYSEGGSLIDMDAEESVLYPQSSTRGGEGKDSINNTNHILHMDSNDNYNSIVANSNDTPAISDNSDNTPANNNSIFANRKSFPANNNGTPTVINFASLLTDPRLPTVQEATAILNSFLADVPSSSSAPDANSRWIAVSFDPNENKDVASIHILHGKDRKLALKALTVAEAEDCSMKIPSLEHYGALFEPRLITSTDGKHSYQLWTTEFTHSKQLDAHYILDVVKFSQKVKNQVGLINGIIARENVTPEEIKQALKKFMTVTPESDLFEERFRDKYYQPKVKYFYDKRLTSSWTMVPKFVPGLGDTKVLDIQTIETPENVVNNTISKRVRRKPGAH